MSEKNMENGESLKGNFAYNLIYQILVIILPLITAPYVTRVLGADNLGVYTYSQAIANFFYLFAMLGVNNYGNRAIARIRDDRIKLNTTFTEIFIFQFLLGVLCTITYMVYIAIFVKENQVIFLLQIFYVLSGAVDINWACFGLEKFKIAALRSMVIRIGLAVCIFAFVKSENDIGLYTLLLSLQYFISVVAIWPFVLKYVSFRRITINGVLKHIKPNVMLFFPIIAISIYNIMDKVMLGFFSPSDEVAFYNYAERLVTIPVTCIMALDNVMMPRMSYLYAKKDDNRVNLLMDTIMLFSIFLSAAMCFGLAGVGKDFTVWFYGNAFERCGLFVLLLTPTILFKGTAGALRTLFIIPAQKDKIYLASLVIGAVVNVILNSLLIPNHGGIGAIIGTVAAEFAVCFTQFFMTKSEITFSKFFIDAVSFCTIGILMFLLISHINIINSLSIVNLAVKILAGAVFYILTGATYMIFVRRNVVLVNEVLHILRIKYRFKVSA